MNWIVIILLIILQFDHLSLSYKRRLIKECAKYLQTLNDSPEYHELVNSLFGILGDNIWCMPLLVHFRNRLRDMVKFDEEGISNSATQIFDGGD